MKPIKIVTPLAVAASILVAAPVFGQFSGSFGGYYAPSNWTSQVYNNPTFQNTAFVFTGGAPGSLQIDGAVDSQQQVSTPQPPVSIIDYTILLSGSGLQPVMFNYRFTGAADGLDGAALIYDSGSGLQVVGSLSSFLDGSLHSYFDNTSFQGGQRFGFRVYSNNDNLADTLQIIAVPEPSTLTLLGLGAGIFVWNTRRRSPRR